MKNDLSDTEESLIADNDFLAELGKSCSTKTEEFQVEVKTRGEELVAISETIKVLNDDESLELFKKTLPSTGASLLQMDASVVSMQARALAAIRQAQQAD